MVVFIHHFNNVGMFRAGCSDSDLPAPKKRADVCSKDWRPAFFHLDAHITCEFCAGPLANTQAGCGLRLSFSAVQGK